MEKMREFMQSWLGKLVLLIVLAPMAFLGVANLDFGGHIGHNDMVKVDKTAISISEYNNELANRKARLQETTDPSLINEKALADEVLESIVSRALLENQAKFLGMSISDETITRLLQTDPSFADENGNFSNELFAQYLQSRGMTNKMLFEIFRTQLSLRQLTSSILSQAIYPEWQISRLIDLQSKNREVWLYRYSWQDFADKVSVADDEIKSYYEAHKAELKIPATITLNYLELDKDAIKAEAPTQEELQAQYQIYLQSVGAGTKELAQILLTGTDADAKAKEISEKLAKGESFESLAKTYSDDPTGKTGGAIGAFNPDVFGQDAQMVSGVIQKLAVGDVSEPVKTAFGVQIFKVLKASDAPTFDSVKDELTRLAIAQKRDDAIKETIAKINNMATDGMGISDIAKEMNMTVKTIASYPQENNQTELSMPTVLAAAFDEKSLAEKTTSVNLDVAGKTLWIQADNYQAAKNLSLEEATNQVKLLITKEKASQLAYEAVLSKIAENKGNPKALATKDASIGVVNVQSPALNAAEKASLFSQDDGDVSLWAVQTDEGASLMVGSKIVANSQSQLDKAQRMQIQFVIRSNAGQDQLSDYLQYLKDTKKVEINTQALNAQ